MHVSINNPGKLIEISYKQHMNMSQVVSISSPKSLASAYVSR